MIVAFGNGFGPSPPLVTGRYVHAWNNIGRLVLDDGSFAYTSFNKATWMYNQIGAGTGVMTV